MGGYAIRMQFDIDADRKTVLPREPEPAVMSDPATVRLSATQTVNRPAEEMFAFLADPGNNPRWQRGMRTCAWTSPPPVRVGSTYEQEAAFLGRRLVTRFVVDDYDAGRTVTFRSVSGPFPITVRRTVMPLSATTSRVEADITGRPGRFFRIAGPLLKRLAQRSVTADYRRLKALLESP